ncbi:MAG: FAD-dependent oxidoreductase [Deltaproteobacteria bacterium]|nr:FAD-dependent oxidoreductase [Deltaproteobacteria bacterium]
MKPFKHLFAPGKIGKVELKNRIVMLPMTTGYTEADETVGNRFMDFFEARAKGGAALIIIPFSPVHAGSPVEPGMYDDRFVAPARKLTGRIHEGGAKIGAQLIISYHVIFGKGAPEVVGPSPVMNQIMRCIPRELTVDEIRFIVSEYGKAARRVREAGFDLVEVLVGGGYLLNRFLSPITNKRTDSYGGSLENRMRFTLEVIESMRKEVGADFPIGIRLNLEEQMEGGHTIEDSKEVLKIIEKAGVQVINAYTGWHESPVPTVQGFLPKGAFAHLAEKAKGWVKIPVIAANRINDPVVAEKILADGMADFVGMGRALLADPELPNKAREGRINEMVPCIACSNCLSEIISTYRKWGQPTTTYCTVNPMAGKESEYRLEPVKKPKKVFVVGGGPAGLEAAMIAAMRGHRVTLYEKGKEPGGWLLVGCLPPHKDEIGNLYKSLAVRTKKAGVEIRLNHEATPKTIEEAKPDVLILALGANPLIPKIPGVTGANVVMAEDLLTGRKTVSGSVIIIGGGLVGCETAEFLIKKGQGVTGVTVVEMLERMAETLSAANRPFFLARLKKEGVEMKTRTTVKEITDKGVKVNQNGTSGFIEGDAVVLAVGLKAEAKLVESFMGKAPEVYSVGDCVKPRMIKEAMEEGFLTGRKI